MDVPNVKIVFDPKILQFVYSSVKLNRLPQKCDQILQNFLEELNQIGEKKFLCSHQTLLKLMVANVFLLTLAFLKLYFLYIFLSTLALFSAALLFVLYKIKKVCYLTLRLLGKYKTPIKQYYSTNFLFSLRRHLVFFMNVQASELDYIEFQNPFSGEFQIIDSFPLKEKERGEGKRAKMKAKGKGRSNKENEEVKLGEGDDQCRTITEQEEGSEKSN